MATGRHAKRIGLLMLAAGLLLGWLVVHTEIFYTDGLRYIAQARTIDQGSLAKGTVSFGRPSRSIRRPSWRFIG